MVTPGAAMLELSLARKSGHRPTWYTSQAALWKFADPYELLAALWFIATGNGRDVMPNQERIAVRSIDRRVLISMNFS
jgi:hypothetical protein